MTTPPYAVKIPVAQPGIERWRRPRECSRQGFIWDGARIELKTFPYPYEKTIAKLASLRLRTDALNDLATVLRTGGRLEQS